MSVLSSAHTDVKTIILFSPLSCKNLARGQSQTWTAASDGWAHRDANRSTLRFILPNSKDQRSANASCQRPVGTICPNYPVSPWLARPNHTPYINKGAKSWWTFLCRQCFGFERFGSSSGCHSLRSCGCVATGGWRNGRHTQRSWEEAGYLQCTLLTSILQPGEGFAVSLSLEPWDPRE